MKKEKKMLLEQFIKFLFDESLFRCDTFRRDELIEKFLSRNNFIIGKEFTESLKELNEVIGKFGFIVCGSLALKLQGYLDRPVGDIDIITMQDYYHHSHEGIEEYRKEKDGYSRNFVVDGQTVSCFSIWTKAEGMKVDIFSMNKKPQYTVLNIGGIDIMVEDATSVIAAKRSFIHDGNLYHKEKHEEDLKHIDNILNKDERRQDS